MKLSIRVKLFVVLLAFSLGPLLIARGITGGAADKMARKLSAQTRAELLEIVTAELEYNVMSILRQVEGKGQALALGVRVLAQQTELLLRQPRPTASFTPYFSVDFRAHDGPPDAGPAPHYQRMTMSGESRPMRVSMAHPTYHLPRGDVTQADRAEIARLQELLPTFIDIQEELSDAMFWAKVALPTGLLAAYPGHGGMPVMYDPRNDEWYKQARRNNGLAWDIPRLDPATRRMVATASYPVRDDRGEFAGAAAIDVPLATVLHETDLKSRWAGEIQSFMVTRYPGDTTTNDGLLILARRSYEEGGRRHWTTGIEPEWMRSDDPEAFKQLLLDMARNGSGTLRLPFEGQDSVWAYASNPTFSFVLIAPESVVTRLPDAVAGSVNSLFDDMRDISAIISGVMLIVAGIFAWLGTRAITRPLLAMADAATRLARGDFSVRMDWRGGDERDIVVNSFNDMVPKLRERMLLRRDLELAEEVQRLLLPRETPRLSGFDISGGIAYCDQTGGDYYDFFEVLSDVGTAWAAVVGDVSGHGVPSALLMATARGQLHTLSHISMRPHQRIQKVNDFLSRDMDGTGRFLTLFYLRLKKDDPVVRWVRAGHDPAIHYLPATDTFSELGGDGIALGVVEDFEFQSFDAELAAGDVLVLATDGVRESRNKAGEMFGKQRMLAIIRQNAHKSAEAIRLALMEAVDGFQANGQEDDIAVVVIKKV